MQSDADERQAWLMWLTRLRWVALFAQTITLGFSIGVLSSPTLLIPLAIIICALALANVRALQVMQSDNDVADETLLWQLGLDVLALTTFFLLAGGPDSQAPPEAPSAMRSSASTVASLPTRWNVAKTA